MPEAASPYFIFTLDYELYGDGSGDVFEHMIKPTEELLQLFGETAIKITIFFEVIEYWRLKEEWEKGNTMGYSNNPISAIDNQIRKAIQDGHDVQLHLHPQWLGAEYKNDKWIGDEHNYRLSKYRNTKNVSLEALIKSGAETLERIICPVKSGYQCLALRAGWYNVDPGYEIIEAMKSCGLMADSSVVPGAFNEGDIADYDFREVPEDLPFWYTDSEDMRKTAEAEEKKGILELPVFSINMRRIWKLKPKGLLSRFLKKRNTSEARERQIKKLSRKEKLKYLFQNECFTWDFCNSSRAVNASAFRKLKSLAGSQDDGFRPVVLIGHSKSPVNQRGLQYILKKMRENGGRACTMTEAINQISSLKTQN